MVSEKKIFVNQEIQISDIRKHNDIFYISNV